MKTNKIFIKSIFAGVLIMGLFNSCQKKYLDVNKNPNFPADVDVNYLLPTTEAAIGQALGNDLAIHGGMWAQYWTQNSSSSQYKTIDQYSPNASDFDYPWDALYTSGLQNMATIVTKATAENKPNYAAIAKILQAYTFQLLTDDFGDIPFSQALQGTSGITSPKYDPQQNVYSGIITLLNQAQALININAVAPSTPGTDDIIFGGSMTQWQKFANTLLLRVYLRMAYVSPATAQAGIAALGASSAPFLVAGDSVYISYTSTGGNTNPLYGIQALLGPIQNLVASATAINYLLNYNDYRIYAFYDPSTVGSYIGITQGNYNVQTATFAIPSPMTGADFSDANASLSATAPVRLMTSWESLFLQAEAVARGWLPSTNGTDQALYNAGITESFVRAGIGLQDSDAFNYYSQAAIAYPTGGSLEGKIQAIITQKWISMCGIQCNEGWTEWRRTGYPNFFTQSVTSILGPGQFPQRMFYPSGEEAANQNFPGQKPITTKVWWDVH